MKIFTSRCRCRPGSSERYRWQADRYVFNDHISQAKAAADAAVKFIGGEEVDAKIPVDYIKVTNANAQEIF